MASEQFFLDALGFSFLIGHALLDPRPIRGRCHDFPAEGHQCCKFRPALRRGQSLKLLRPGGLLATFSCSGGVTAELFQSIVAGAAADAGGEAKVLERFGAPADHPIALAFPEGDYLKGLLVVRT